MNVFNKYFQKIFVLSMKDDIERQFSVIETLKGVEFEFVWGPNIKKEYPNAKSIEDLPLDFFIKNEIDRAKVIHWSIGGLGCGLGHRKVIQKIVDSGLENALILEDDVIMVKNAAQRFHLMSKYIPENWELLYLGYMYPTKIMKLSFLPNSIKRIYGRCKKLNFLDFSSNEKKRNFFPRYENKYFEKSGVLIGGHSYALTQVAAVKLLKQNIPMSIYSDILLMKSVYLDIIRSYNVKEILFEQNKDFNSYTE